MKKKMNKRREMKVHEDFRKKVMELQGRFLIKGQKKSTVDITEMIIPKMDELVKLNDEETLFNVKVKMDRRRLI